MNRRLWIPVGLILFSLLAAASLVCLIGRRESKTGTGGTRPPAQTPSKTIEPEPTTVGMGTRSRPTGRGLPDAGDASLTSLPCEIRLREVTDETGVTQVHSDGSSGQRYIVESMSAGLATFDYDGDGLVDIYFPNGAPLPGATADRPPRHALYRNLGGWRFQDVTEAAGVACRAYGLGITVGDYNHDGRPDIYLNNFGPNVLYRNNGDGTFTDVTQKTGVGRGNLVGAGACFLDIDGSGTLDLYVGNYIALDLSKHVPRKAGRFPAYPSPADYAPVPDTLYRNQGDGTFTDVSKPSGIASSAGRSMGMICADYDNDGSTDIFVCNDVQENILFHNDGTGKFEEVGLLAGVALNGDGEILANMAVDSGDYNHDGWLDFFTTNYEGQQPVLFRNLGRGIFEDVCRTSMAGAAGFRYVNWGCGMVDFDNDGYRDLFLANGHTEDNMEERDPTAQYRCPNLLLRNLGNGRFANVSEQSGISRLPPHAARGAAFDDMDNDGDIDVAIQNSREKPTLLRNMLYEAGSKNHWLQIRLQGVKTNRDGVGARVKVVAGDLTQIDEVHSGRGYQSHWGTRLHFGMGHHEKVDRIEVRWIGGGVDVLENQAVNHLLTIVEGQSEVAR